MKKIVLKTHPVSNALCGVVRISPKAEKALKELRRQTGLSAKYIASELILQGAELVEVKGNDVV